MTHQQNLKEVLQLLEISEKDLRSIRARLYVDWLKSFTDGNTEFFLKLIYHPQLLDWWLMTWNSRDQNSILHELGKYQPEVRLMAYEVIHTAECYNMTPPYKMVKTAYQASIRERC